MRARAQYSRLCLLGLWLQSIAACDVYDPDLLRSGSAGSGVRPPRDAGSDSDANVFDDAGAPLACISLEDPSCPEYCPESCNGDDDDCDGKIDEGGIDVLCHLADAVSVCAQGKCLVASCTRGHVDCNELAADGCEDALDSVERCGLCTQRCLLPHAQPACHAGSCAVESCAAGFGDCDKRADNGCERPLDTLSDCGGCAVPCNRPHARNDCSTGRCTFTACDSGFGDCNADPSDGCETPLDTPMQCGACGLVCPSTAPFCSGGKCSAISCPADSADCDGDNQVCETSLRTVQNCGSCGAACGALAHADVSCTAEGSCKAACQAGWDSCDSSVANGCETNLRSNENCGACGQTCTYANAVTSCASGGCGLASCTGGYGNCNGVIADGCEQRLNTTTHCSLCNTACGPLAHASANCDSGSCRIASCSAGFGNCDGNAANGCEVELATNAAHCGGCNAACPANFNCVSGRCACANDAGCQSGQSCCSGTCVNLKNNPANCGRCGGSCGSGTCCNGNCKDLTTDLNNCGACGAACNNKSNRCTNGACRCTNDSPCSTLLQCCSSGCELTLFCN